MSASYNIKNMSKKNKITKNNSYLCEGEAMLPRGKFGGIPIFELPSEALAKD
jgi:hypothetical protein